MKSVLWNTIKLFDGTDDIMEAWLGIFLQVVDIVDKHVPIKQYRLKHKKTSTMDFF